MATDLAAQLYVLRVAIGEVDALVAVAVAAYDDGDWHGTDPLQVVRMAYLLGVIAKAATTAVAAVDQFHVWRRSSVSRTSAGHDAPSSGVASASCGAAWRGTARRHTFGKLR